jgi:hypothetical protein
MHQMVLSGACFALLILEPYLIYPYVREWPGSFPFTASPIIEQKSTCYSIKIGVVDLESVHWGGLT